MFSILVGTVFIAISAVLFVRPQIVDWVSDQTNLRAIRLYSQGEEYEKRRKAYPRNVKLLRMFFRIFFALLGIGMILNGMR